MSNKHKNIKKKYNTTQDELEGESASRGYKKEKARKLSKMNLRSKHIDDLLDLMEDNNY